MDSGNWEPKKLSRLNMLMSGMNLLQWWKVLHVKGGEGLFNRRTHLLCEEVLSNTNKKKRHKENNLAVLTFPYEWAIPEISSQCELRWTESGDITLQCPYLAQKARPSFSTNCANHT